MFQWYGNAAECYVFLSDVSSANDDGSQEDTIRHDESIASLHGDVAGCSLEPHNLNMPEFMNSSWFTRGWTLQELLAPRNVLFFNKDYQYIGSKQELAYEISNITGIGPEYLLSRRPVDQASVGVRMRWASRRQCTRREDSSYCLMGLFGVNMPLLYGEGTKAFVRLQLEITKKLHDESLFGWDRQPSDGWSVTPSGDTEYSMLASSAAAFSYLSDGSVTQQDLVRSTFRYRHPYSMTNKGFGLKLDLPSARLSHLTRESYHRCRFWFLLPLNCLMVTKRTNGPKTTHRIALRLGVFYLGVARRAMYATVKDRLISATDQPERLEDFGVEDDGYCLGAIGLEKPVEYFKVYVIQDGV